MEPKPTSDSKAWSPHLETRSGFACKFTRKSGHIVALHYSDLVKIEYNPDLKGIILDYVGDRVTIIGINIMELFDALCEHKVAEVKEMHEPDHMMAHIVNGDGCYVTQLMCEVKG